MGVIDTAKSIFNQLPKQQQPRWRDKAKEFIFNNGAKVKYMHMAHEQDKENITGLQFTLIGVDEADQFTETQIFHMISRLRSQSKYESRLVMTCNPNCDSFLLKFLEGYYIDEEGYPIEDRCGDIRWFIRRDGDFIWGESKEELEEKYGEHCAPRSFSFIGANLYDNPPMMKSNPEYLGNLLNLDPVEKARLLDGCWYARPKGSNYWQREWCPDAKLPINYIENSCRAWDKASSEPSQVNKHPDFTASVKMAKVDGIYYIIGDYIPENKQIDTDILGRVQMRAGERDLLIAKQSAHDSTDCTVVLPKDPSASGAFEFQQSSLALIEKGFTVKADPMPSNKSKLTKFSPFASACENGLVRLCKSTFNAATYEAFCKELEAFDGERSSSHRKDD